MKKSIHIKPGCITCGACEFIAPEAFVVTDICRVRPNLDVEQNKNLLDEAIAACPVQVIHYTDTSCPS